MYTRSSHAEIDAYSRSRTLTRDQINFTDIKPLHIASAFVAIHEAMLKGAASFATEGEQHLRKAADAFIQGAKINL